MEDRTFVLFGGTLDFGVTIGFDEIDLEGTDGLITRGGIITGLDWITPTGDATLLLLNGFETIFEDVYSFFGQFESYFASVLGSDEIKLGI